MQSRSGKPRIFTVEDDPVVAIDIAQSLQELGYELVGSCETGEAAIKTVPEARPDLVLMDIGLKGSMDGIEAAGKITGTFPVPIIFLTGLSDESTLRRARLVRPYGYLIKPFELAELRSTIDVTLDRFLEQGDGTQPAEPPHAEEEEIHLGAGEVDDRTRILSHVSFFRELPSNLLASLAQASSIRALEAGEIIVAEGDKPAGGFVTVSGRVSILKSTENGKELIVSLLAPGDPFGLLFVIPPLSRGCSARTQIPSRVIWLPQSALHSVMQQWPALFQSVTEELAGRLVNAYSLASSLAHSRVEDRIVMALLALLPQFGRTTKDGSNASRIYITRKELAELTGTTPETAIRVTKHLERSNYLDLTRPGIIRILDLDKFKGLTQAKST